jgi:hypothetical protein
MNTTTTTDRRSVSDKAIAPSQTQDTDISNDWHDVVEGLRNLDGWRACVHIGETGGAAAIPAVITGEMRIVEHDEEAGEERLIVQLGDYGTVTLEQLLLGASERDQEGVMVEQATLRLEFFGLAR